MNPFLYAYSFLPFVQPKHFDIPVLYIITPSLIVLRDQHPHFMCNNPIDLSESFGTIIRKHGLASRPMPHVTSDPAPPPPLLLSKSDGLVALVDGEGKR
mmetsp:Transcript_17882/g.29381  ORF Transcript_17882/g.29381 Transcript_17882/m.29381 type:complete len:99 (+) Transcript_17882:310-606(+)